MIGIIVSSFAYPTFTDEYNIVFVGIVQISVFVITAILILLVSRRRSRIAKWFLIIAFALGMIFYVPQLSVLLELGVAGVLSSLQMLMQCIGIYFLFTNESLVWFKGKT